jgi:uncharacterized protein YprB with RNaseH-like and TPR domain
MLRDKLDRLSGHIAKPGTSAPRLATNKKALRAQETLGGEIISRSEGTYLQLTTDFPDTYSHGLYTVNESLNISTPSLYHFDNVEVNDAIDISRLLFFDMETTGLSGGSGTVPFLIGCGSFIDGNLQVRQYFLPDYSDEAAMLEAVRAEINKDTIIVSYNGRAFDLPILLTRLILFRIERNLEYSHHIDLLHSTRRLFRRRLKDCSLGNIEKEILKFYRYDDIPGYLVPAVYFNWLAAEETSELTRVIEHNRHDIVSLFFLMYHISAVLEKPDQNISDMDDLLSLVRLLDRRGDTASIFQLLDDFRENLWENDRYDILMFHALACKRNGIFERAVEIWEKLSAANSPESYLAHIELAKYYEHRRKDYSQAIGFAEKAGHLKPQNSASRDDLPKRIGRLKSKLAR